MRKARDALSFWTFWTYEVVSGHWPSPKPKQNSESELRKDKTRQQHLIKGYLKYTDKRKAQKSLLSFTNACASLHHVVLEQSLSFFLAGIRSWDINLKCCDLDQQLQLFITRHSAHFSSEVRGQCDVALYEPGDDRNQQRILNNILNNEAFFIILYIFVLSWRCSSSL